MSSPAPAPHRLVASGHLRAEELPPALTAAADASPREKGPGWAHGVGLSPLAVAPAGSGSSLRKPIWMPSAWRPASRPAPAVTREERRGLAGPVTGHSWDRAGAAAPGLLPRQRAPLPSHLSRVPHSRGSPGGPRGTSACSQRMGRSSVLGQGTGSRLPQLRPSSAGSFREGPTPTQAPSFFIPIRKRERSQRAIFQ